MLYIAAPYTKPDPVLNVSTVCRVATVIIEQTDWVPFVPHLTLLWHAITPKPISFWYKLDLEHLRHCDAIVRLPGASTGADRELAYATKLGIEIVLFYDLPLDAQRLWQRRGTSS